MERVTKVDAVRRQLRTALRLFFEERDTVSIYTLAAAVQELLRGLLRPLGKGSPLKDGDLVIPEKRKEFLAIINRPGNFLKHADRDPDDVLEFNPEAVPFVLHECVVMYKDYTGRMLREGWAFNLWFASTYPNLLLPGPFKDGIQLAHQKLGMRPEKSLFLELLNRPDLPPNLD